MARKRNEALRLQKRGIIIAAAEKQFASGGFARTSITSVAQEAGISHALIFTYFKSKEELIRAVVLEPLEETLSAYRTLFKEAQDVLATLTRLVDLQAKQWLRRGTFLRVVQQVMGQPEQYPELTAAVYRYGEDFVTLLVPVIEEGQRAGVLAPGNAQVIGWTYFSYINGAGAIFPDEARLLAEATAGYALRIFGFQEV
ncbi:TetR/AcrR family transcriptional regulator ['Paenibacillus yunnanensis' Narsing Rao et al. 2020]|uniref:TetR/AcrR family transcriptional regulator n=1 Tax=Paenibacillus tengchongensis TaxID=2608684 RepID=UPI00124D9A50|nr:TetR/AcrR family transcriptional regulator [Paenibacillus tengchongensis]